MKSARLWIGVIATVVLGVGLAVLLAQPWVDDAGDANGAGGAAANYGRSTDAPVATRIVSAAPPATEALFAMGLGDRIVACSDYDTWPAARIADLPRVGGYLDPNLERLIALEPNLLLFQGKFPKLREFAELHAITYGSYSFERIDGILTDIRAIATRCGAPERGDELATAIRADLDAIATAVAGREPTPMLLTMFRQPGTLRGISTIGGETFLDDLIAIAGGRNVANGNGYIAIALEAILDAGPAVIVETAPGGAVDWDARRADWDAFPTIPAVRDNRIVRSDEAGFVTPGPRIVRTALTLAIACHPDAPLPTTLRTLELMAANAGDRD